MNDECAKKKIYIYKCMKDRKRCVYKLSEEI